MTSIYEIAEDFIQHTDCPVFITGKAGTGKTTLLRQIKEGTFKQVAVVAPTGVAAINAEGSTIHSLFQLPFSPFIPTPEGRRQLISKHQMSAVRQKVLRNIELLIIDEISMVRADLLDAVDTVLRHYRYRHSEPFGGVQVVYIGDMYQLPPVCVGDEMELLRHYYPSPYFFHSKVVTEQPPVYIELDKIFRQSNIQFINLLNEVRNNSLTNDTLALMNLRYKPGFRASKDDGYITLTTHNASADAINTDEISKIDAPYHKFTAKIEGEFPEKSFPTDIELNLKEGAKVMFIANDASQPRRYFNGKLGVITDITDDEIWVTCNDETEPILVKHEIWENKSYTINREGNKLEEKLLGTFMQYPLRLAWAITIHKSQGLTFDKVIIDAGAAFASGQVYVALSRCRSLDGIVLTSTINPYSLAVDPNIVQYCNNRLPVAELEQQVEIFKQQYSIQLLSRIFSLETLMSQTLHFYNYVAKITDDFNPETAAYIEELKTQVNAIYSVALRFLAQLNTFNPKTDAERIEQRIAAAAAYYVEQLTQTINLIEASPAITESKVEAQDYVERLQAVFDTAHQNRSIIAAIASDISVTNIFAAKQNAAVPKFRVKAYAAEREVRLLKTDHPTLYSRLAAWRNSYCREHNIPVYQLFSNASLVDLSNKLPLTAAQLPHIHGFGKVKTEKYGSTVIEIIRQYCIETGIDTDSQAQIDFAAAADNTNAASAKPRTKAPKAPKTDTVAATLELLQEGLGIEQVAERRNLTASTIYTHLAKLIHNRSVSIHPYIDNDTLQQVMNQIEENPGQSNTELFEHFNGTVSYNQLRLIRAHQLSLDSPASENQ